ncbi:hypothetical protein DBR06_SOUSAS5510144, partial [Sousa chinensis]
LLAQDLFPPLLLSRPRAQWEGGATPNPAPAHGCSAASSGGAPPAEAVTFLGTAGQ